MNRPHWISRKTFLLNDMFDFTGLRQALENASHTVEYQASEECSRNFCDAYRHNIPVRDLDRLGVPRTVRGTADIVNTAFDNPGYVYDMAAALTDILWAMQLAQTRLPEPPRGDTADGRLADELTRAVAQMRQAQKHVWNTYLALSALKNGQEPS